LVTAALRVGVLALQGDVANHLQMLALAGADEVVTVRRPAELAAVDALVVPGGESSVIDKLARRVGLFDPLRARIAAGMPVLGTCAGLIMLADRVEGAIDGQRSLGGIDMVARRNAFGRQVDSFEVDLTVAGLDEPFRAVFIRAPWVAQVGPSVQVLAAVTAPDGRTHPVAVRQGALMATAFHPELTADSRLHRAFVQLAGLAATGGAV
jgi:5'-phosphate synthase pdxT subunit